MGRLERVRRPYVLFYGAMNRTLIIFSLLAACTFRSAEAQVMRAERPSDPPVEATAGTELTDQEKMDRIINDSLIESNTSKVAAAGRQMSLIVGDIRRVTNLNGDRLRMLEIAAKGAVDRSLEPWRVAQESRVREQINGAALETLKDRISSVGEVHVGGTQPQETTMWTEPLRRTLSTEELEKWNQAQSDRNAYRATALSNLLISEMERKLTLTPVQTEKLEPLLRQAFIDYLPDMSSYIDRNSGIDFRLLSLVMNGVSEEARNNILTSGQQATLQNQNTDFMGWWQSIYQNHQRRVGGSNPLNR